MSKRVAAKGDINEIVESVQKLVDVFFVYDILIQVVRTQRNSNDSTSLKQLNLIQKKF